jgi:hypothetical protein
MTPPEEARRRQRVAEEAAAAEMSVLVLAPFNAFPTVSFEGVKLGSAAVRRLCVRNPAAKDVKVRFTMPKGEAGFEIDYAEFPLPAGREAVVNFGWVPRSGGNVAEKATVRYGPGMQTRISLVGQCSAPREKPARRVPLAAANRGKRGAAAKAPPLVKLPMNPIERMAAGSGGPETRPIPLDEMPPPPALRTHLQLPAPSSEPSWSPQKICEPPTASETSVAGEGLPDASVADDSVFARPDIRRETFVATKPPQLELPPTTAPPSSASSHENPRHNPQERPLRKETYTLPQTRLARKDTYTVKVSKDVNTVSQTLGASSVKMTNAGTSFVSSTPASKGPYGAKLGVDVSLIKSAADGTAEQYGVQRPTRKGLHFTAEGFKENQLLAEEPSERRGIRRETFVAEPAIAKAETGASSKNVPKVSKEDMFKMDLTNLVEEFINRDDSNLADSDVGVAINRRQTSEAAGAAEWVREGSKAVDELLVVQEKATETVTTVTTEVVQRHPIALGVREEFLNTPSPLNISALIEDHLRSQENTPDGPNGNGAMATTFGTRAEPLNTSLNVSALIENQLRLQEEELEIGSVGNNQGPEMTDSRETYVVDQHEDDDEEILHSSGGDMAIGSAGKKTVTPPEKRPPPPLAFDITPPSFNIMPTLDEVAEEEESGPANRVERMSSRFVAMAISPPKNAEPAMNVSADDHVSMMVNLSSQTGEAVSLLTDLTFTPVAENVEDEDLSQNEDPPASCSRYLALNSHSCFALFLSLYAYFIFAIGKPLFFLLVRSHLRRVPNTGMSSWMLHRPCWLMSANIQRMCRLSSS